MIKKYTALCLIISSLTLCSAEKEPTETTFVISSKKTAWFQSLDTRFNIVMNKQQQEHAAQQQKMKLDHEENIKKLSQIFIARVQENDVIFTKQFDDNQKRIEEQAKNVQEVLNSSATYQLVKLNLDTAEYKLTGNREDLEKMEIYRQGLYVATPILSIGAIITGCSNQSLSIGGFSTLVSGLILGGAYCYVADRSSSIGSEIALNEESVKKLETILIQLRPATENKEDENIQSNDEETHD